MCPLVRSTSFPWCPCDELFISHFVSARRFLVGACFVYFIAICLCLVSRDSVILSVYELLSFILHQRNSAYVLRLLTKSNNNIVFVYHHHSTMSYNASQPLNTNKHLKLIYFKLRNQMKQ